MRTVGISDWQAELVKIKYPSAIVAWVSDYLEWKHLAGVYREWWDLQGARLFSDCAAEHGFFVFFDDEEEAVGWVLHFPKAAGYCALFVNGEIVQEN